MSVEGHSLFVVIPAYRAAGTIADVVARIPHFVDRVIIVDDASPDRLEAAVQAIPDTRVVYLKHERNLGVGGAMVTGYRRALEMGADLVAKIDADGQMDPQYLDRFAVMAARHRCDYVKANRFGHLEALPTMPRARLVGSLGLTFLTKLASGCWNVFDPQNGYVLVSRRLLRRLDLDHIDPGYFFENSMLIHLNVFRARIGEIYLPAIYDREISSLRVSRILTSFPAKLLKGFFWRIYQKYVFRSLTPVAVLLGFSLVTFLWGAAWGGYHWWKSIASGIPATTGTVILALLPILMGFSALLQALVLDVQDAGPSILFDYEDEALTPSEIRPPAAGRVVREE